MAIFVFKQLPTFTPLNFKPFFFNFSTQILSKRGNFDSATRQKSSKFLVYCNSQITKLGRNGCIKEAESIFNRMPNKNTVSWTALLTAYAENSEINKAREVFNKIPDPNVASYNAMITAYHRRNMVDEAFELFSSMPQRNSVSYATMITGFVHAGMFDMAEKLHREKPVIVSSNVLINGYSKVGRVEDAVRIFDGMAEKDVVSWSSMISGLCRVGKIVEARKLFDKMPDRNVVTWTLMIDGYMKMNFLKDGFILFLNMRREGVEVNATTLTVLLEACGSFDRYGEGIQIHGLVLSLGFDVDAYLANSIITMYSRCYSIDAAAKQFDLMVKKDIVTWNSLITGYVQSGNLEKAVFLFENMPQKDVVSWTTLICGFASEGRIDEFIGLFQMMPEKDAIAWTAVISGLVSIEEYEIAFHCNDDLTHEHHQFFLYQMLRVLKFMHTVDVYHRDLKPKNILANANCKLKICYFGLARVAFSDTPTKHGKNSPCHDMRSTVCTNLVSPDHEPFWRNPKVCNDSMGLPDRTFGNLSKAHPPPKVPTGRVAGPILP
ncbi:hypothetical protein Csa_009009 [Cucumis sativus]|nr:hypothetical protein Csa_009009 [Cucumis sativus]